ncbi:uncharacterized protein K452DRAFT_286932 [Aplosporella prunicola CBS 121167]|uniref:Life-span regulatory factor domain-containing protein n=1 Tax=Aplosporella prunicola CBS 121167 TaxID=1176127 RepID=A0A6A6BGS2_9PEZI|nr:uncharacterized protein K452DRAFT_286932 [Aplosporella prunicola CBS 121167]KAF2142515.1 hypothetical protein K452DRAFT_286932 [Aplosporella prunicola CBS 121167]
MAAEWSHDFCLSCDKQIAEGAYCSQACRLADLDKASSECFSSSMASSYASSNNSGFYLPPAVNFSAYKTKTDSPPTSPAAYSPRQQQSYFSSNDASKRTLSPSSSRSSLSSVTTPTQGLSAEAATQLRGYTQSFDQVRDMRRRKTSA